ncbi:hypothetical protein APU02_19595 [Citrobacter sp. 50677481]|nr:hypothetical protein APU02_19595 [Citrobacter sp. 50677481]
MSAVGQRLLRGDGPVALVVDDGFADDGVAVPDNHLRARLLTAAAEGRGVVTGGGAVGDGVALIVGHKWRGVRVSGWCCIFATISDDGRFVVAV